MEKQKSNKSILELLETLELVGITFIRGYIQFLVEESILNTYTLPRLKTKDKTITSKDFGYYDTLHSLIGKKIISAFEEEKEEKIAIKFEDDTELLVSLKSEDRNCVEAVMLQVETNGGWNIW